MDIFNELSKFTNPENILKDEPMKNHTTFKIGGNADFLVSPSSMDEISNIISFLKENDINFAVIGNGSNLLVSDKGFRGVIIRLHKNFCGFSVEGDCITAEGGILLSRLANIALENSLTGFEFASGIPGSLAGATFMNAGAYGPELKDVILEVTFIDKNNEIKTIGVDECDFGYRTSYFSKNNAIVLSVKLKLSKGDRAEIKKTMDELNKRRSDKQPLTFPSAGSVFKRPVGHFAGALVEQAGLKNYSIGGAMVSEKHAGFIINTGDATCEDVLNLIEYIKKTVYDKFGVTLEPEVRMLGEF
ncbi:MAG: UDP-N-acetylmuramate dehydrogenase [Clostridia bacterium]|nr:UDP-N-acetylmuramate dehydrogenase [Clostridia bacterium]